jgi:hypothetical protein
MAGSFEPAPNLVEFMICSSVFRVCFGAAAMALLAFGDTGTATALLIVFGLVTPTTLEPVDVVITSLYWSHAEQLLPPNGGVDAAPTAGATSAATKTEAIIPLRVIKPTEVSLTLKLAGSR